MFVVAATTTTTTTTLPHAGGGGGAAAVAAVVIAAACSHIYINIYPLRSHFGLQRPRRGGVSTLEQHGEA